MPPIRILTLRLLSLLLLLCGGSDGAAQNLVLNGDFERFNACASGANNGPAFSPDFSRFPTVQDWGSAVPSCDYFQAECTPVFSVPGNWLGYQPAHSGQAYTGFFSYYVADDGTGLRAGRENLVTRLASALERDSIYELRFFVSPTFRSGPGGSFGQPVTVNEIGANFSDTMPRFGTTYNLDIPYHVVNDPSRPLDDTSRWYEIRGKYRARGGERWLTIGNFRRDGEPAYTGFAPAIASDPWRSAYIYLDDVSLMPVPPAHRTHYASICGTPEGSILLVSPHETGVYHWNTRQATRSIAVSRAGTYTCIVSTDTSTYVDVFEIDKVHIVPPAISDTTVCLNAIAPTLRAPDTGLVWYASADDTIGTPRQPGIVTAVPGTRTLYVARRESYCVSDRSEITVTVRAPPESVALMETPRCMEIAANAVTIGSPREAWTRYNWDNGDSLCCIHTARDGLHVRRSNNECGASLDSFFVRPASCDPCVVFPDAFTPNGDGRNDHFAAMIRCPIREYLLRIYNRWGECVFVGSRPDLGWDGCQNGVAAPVGTYMYVLHAMHASNGAAFQVKGPVTIIR